MYESMLTIDSQTDIRSFQSEEYSRSLHFIDKRQKSLHLMKICPYYRKRRLLQRRKWTTKETILYLQFLKNNFSLFENENLPKIKITIFVHMERFIKTQNFVQCRYHHNQMKRRYNNTQGIIQSIQSFFSGSRKCFRKMNEFKGLYTEIQNSSEQSIYIQNKTLQILENNRFFLS